MKTLFASSFFSLAAAVALHAAPTLTIGTPGNSNLATPSLPTSVGAMLNFDALTPGTSFNPDTYSSMGVSISSPDGLTVQPYSDMSAPNYLVDNGANGTADISIKTTTAWQHIGVGIADSDLVSIQIQALNAQGNPFGSVFQVMTDPDSGNGYFIINDTSSDLFGIRILQKTANPDFSGLAIDDVQFAPEPTSVAMLACGGLLLAGLGLRKRA